MKTKIKKKTETFRVTSGMIVFGDPCYSCNPTLPAKNGEWEAAVDKKDCGNWGCRISRVTVHHKDFDPVSSKKSKKTFSVDSGQAGVYCQSVYESEGSFYDACCKETLSSKGYGFIDGGFVSSSGYGDGFYDAVVHKVGDKVVCVELIFIGDDD